MRVLGGLGGEQCRVRGESMQVQMCGFLPEDRED